MTGLQAAIRKRQKAVKISIVVNPLFVCWQMINYFCAMEMTTTIPVTLTEGAIKEIRILMSKEGFDNTQVLRVGVKGGGCSGMTYVLGFDKREENDYDFMVEDIPCVMNKSHEMY